MNLIKGKTSAATLGVAMLLFAGQSHGAMMPVNGTWVITNGNDTVTAGTANTNSPVLAPIPADVSVSSNTIQSPFPLLSLANVGDFVEMQGTVNLVRNAQLTTANRLNDQIRIGLFHATAAPTAGSSGDPRGFIAEYGTGSPAGEIRGLIATQANPFSGGAGTPVIAGAGADPENKFLSGTPVSADFVFRITRAAGNTVNITGSFSGVTVDPLDNDYLQAFSVLGHSPDPSFNFTLNRAAFLIGGNADAIGASLSNVRLRSNLIVPEPASWLLSIGIFAFVGLLRRRG
jgi:hypothetical protein